jgi:hypothetical protein
VDLDIDRYLEFVTPKSGDSTYSVLKAHLLIEEILNSFLERKLNHPEALKGARLSFAQKLSIVRSLARSQPDHWAFQAVEKINAIRNSLAHERQPKDLAKKIRDYIEIVTKNTGVPLPQSSGTNGKPEPPVASDGPKYYAIDVATIGLYVQLHSLLEVKDQLMIAPK